jgi:phosphoenolpyruvate carboxykinase (ATP)
MSSISQIAHPELADLLVKKSVHRNLSTPKLVETAIQNNEGVLSSRGALVSETGKRTGRSPKDKFTVKDAITGNKVAWGAVNLAFPPEKFDALYQRVLQYLAGKEIYVQDLFCGADPKYQLPIQVINEYAWHNLFVHQLFIRPTSAELKTHKPEFTIVSAPGFLADPKRDGTNSEVFVIVNFTRKIVIIGGTQ